MIQAIRNALTLPDLRRKLVYTLLILVIYRVAAHVPVPGVDQEALSQMLAGSGGTSKPLTSKQSERLSLKLLNEQAETRLVYYAEPLGTVASML